MGFRKKLFNVRIRSQTTDRAGGRELVQPLLQEADGSSDCHDVDWIQRILEIHAKDELIGTRKLEALKVTEGN